MSGFVSVLRGAPRVPWSRLDGHQGMGKRRRVPSRHLALFPPEQLCLHRFDVLGSGGDFRSAVAWEVESKFGSHWSLLLLPGL